MLQLKWQLFSCFVFLSELIIDGAKIHLLMTKLCAKSWKGFANLAILHLSNSCGSPSMMQLYEGLNYFYSPVSNFAYPDPY
jgi:hypothetical protein